MPIVTIGGTFLVSHDPARLLDWFEQRFGLEIQRHDDGGSVPLPSAGGVAILGVQKARAEAPRPPTGDVTREPYGRQPMMLNLRVTGLDGIVAAFTDAKEPVAGPVEYEGMGRFAWVRTPDGHDVELWEAPAS